MPLVHVVDLGLRVPGQPAERADRPDATDAEEQFLAEAVIGAAAVEAVGDVALGRRVALDIRIQQEQRDRGRPGKAIPGLGGHDRAIAPGS